MKIATMNSEFKKVLAPPIPMERPAPKTYDKTESLEFKLKSTPGQEASSTYTLTVPYFSTGTPEGALLFFRGVEQVMVGQSITAAADKFQLVERLLNGDALANLKQSKTTRRAITDAAFSFCKKSLLAHVFPPMALKKQKKYMRSGIKKPRGQRIREFDARRMELMAYMEEFPDWEEGKGFDEDEQKEQMEKAIPNSWYQQCHLHNIIDPGKTIIDLIKFCECIEIAEAVAQQNGVSTPSNQSKKKCKRAESQTK